MRYPEQAVASHAHTIGAFQRTLFGSSAAAFGLLAAIVLDLPGQASPTSRRAPDSAASTPTLIRGVRVFDGERVIALTDVLVRDGVVARIGSRLVAPAGAVIIDGTGKTLLPGLIDSHTHVYGSALDDALPLGVTTELDMFSDVSTTKAFRRREQAGLAASSADMRSAGTLVTAPGGHGTEYGMVIPTITRPAEAQAFVDARIAEGSDYIKIVYDDGKTYGMNTPTLDRATLTAVITAAHNREKLAVVHIGSQQGARDAIEAGADGLVHLFVDRAPDADFAALVRAHRAFVIPTLTVNESVTGVPSGRGLVDDQRLAPYITPESALGLARAFPRRESLRNGMTHAAATVRQLDSLGVPLLAGTDAPNPGTAHGASIHRELELLVAAGLTPIEALTAATSTPARVFRLSDRGRIAAGLRADLVLVNGDPTRDITATRDIAAIWKHGAAVDRASARARVAKAREDARLAAERSTGALQRGVISDFDGGKPDSEFGAGWIVSTDQMAGGRSTATLAVAPDGASGTRGALAISGAVAAGLPYAWAGAMFSPGSQPMAPADLSSRKEVAFWAKGDGKEYRLMLFAQSKGMAPLIQTFVAGPEWTEVRVPFASFGGIDGHDIMGMVFAAGPTPGEFAFKIDGVRLR